MTNRTSSGGAQANAFLAEEPLDFSLILGLLGLPRLLSKFEVSLLSVEFLFALDEPGGPLLEILLPSTEPTIQILALALQVAVLFGELLADEFQFATTFDCFFRGQMKVIRQPHPQLRNRPRQRRRGQSALQLQPGFFGRETNLQHFTLRGSQFFLQLLERCCSLFEFRLALIEKVFATAMSSKPCSSFSLASSFRCRVTWFSKASSCCSSSRPRSATARAARPAAIPPPSGLSLRESNSARQLLQLHHFLFGDVEPFITRERRLDFLLTEANAPFAFIGFVESQFHFLMNAVQLRPLEFQFAALLAQFQFPTLASSSWRLASSSSAALIFSTRCCSDTSVVVSCSMCL